MRERDHKRQWLLLPPAGGGGGSDERKNVCLFDCATNVLPSPKRIALWLFGRRVPMFLSNVERSQKLPLEWIYLSKILYQHQSSFKGAANSQSFPWICLHVLTKVTRIRKVYLMVLGSTRSWGEKPWIKRINIGNIYIFMYFSFTPSFWCLARIANENRHNKCLNWIYREL